ncbi:XTP/dITP diphosphatase [Halalkalibacter hemicellulosilyticus]|uniref:dITP/XTP pyrophosphatase n=1 Tax=Halalkalibacter hemicellulosilyticusJCM 9152 TaxID=1236971 RepID=W4QDZ3_9BACI|nr:XTP/dITP diphosphatase [Halalkalibacter hemicellulosilyticus]GAE30172.1 nucleoside 5-triphosphatase RdgB [Halalkalibacter hemicellulosilyticusJCM 9152]
MKQEVIIATLNEGKVHEFKQLFSADKWIVRSLKDFSKMADIMEDGQTFAENATIKAETLSKELGRMVIADDSGLIIDALDGRPGIYSARYAGEKKDDEANMRKVLQELEDVPSEDRSARFFCAIAVARPNEQTLVYEGACEGYIAREKSGTYGFGYDPIFYVPDLQRTMAELTPQEKNERSHRAKAIAQLFAHENEWNKE